MRFLLSNARKGHQKASRGIVLPPVAVLADKGDYSPPCSQPFPISASACRISPVKALSCPYSALCVVYTCF